MTRIFNFFKTSSISISKLYLIYTFDPYDVSFKYYFIFCAAEFYVMLFSIDIRFKLLVIVN